MTKGAVWIWPFLNSNDYWFVDTEWSDCCRYTRASIHKVTGGSVSCPRTLQQSRCLLSWDWLEPKTHRVKTFHPAARWRGVDCCLQQKKRERYSCSIWDSVCFKGSRVQYSAKFSLPSDMSVLFLIHKPVSGLAQLKVKSFALQEQDNLYERSSGNVFCF